MNCVFEYSTSVKRGLNYSLEEPCLTLSPREAAFGAFATLTNPREAAFAALRFHRLFLMC